MKKNKLLILLFICFLSLLLVACQSEISEQETSISFKGTTIYAYIEDISENSLVLSTGNLIEMNGMMQGNQNNPMQEGEMNPGEANSPEEKEGESTEGEKESSEEPPAKPDGEGDTEMNPGEGNQEGVNPGEMNPGEMDAISYFYKSSTTCFLNILDESVIADKDNNKIGLSGLVSGNIISIVMDEAGVVTSIQVLDVTLYDEELFNLGGQMQKDINLPDEGSNN